ENNAVRLVDHTMDENLAACPRVMPVQNLTAYGPVGVLKPCCTIAHQNTHLSMLLKRRDFVDRDAYLGFCRARSVMDEAASVVKAARAKIHGPSGRGWTASI
ncbi:hypothetical protein, partial [Bradyrhizobium cajani]|uniref:hypothetical protein n=1 Tax=Bradyrhizobium cajani TaxID=1928661 RepID=UPI00197AEC80